MNKLKSTCVALGFVLMHTSHLMGSNNNVPSNKVVWASETSDKTQAKANLDNDIERTLLRPVQVKIEETPVAYEPTVAEDISTKTPTIVTKEKPVAPAPVGVPVSPPSKSRTQGERGEGEIQLILKAEKEKLQDMERKYGVLEDELKAEACNSAKDAPSQAPAASPDNRRVSTRNVLSGKNISSVKTGEKPAKSVGVGADNPAIGQQNENSKNFNESNDESLNSRLEIATKMTNSLNLAECYYKLCEYESALKMYKSLTPDKCSAEQYSWAQFQIANCYRNLKDFDAAVGEFKRFISLSQDKELIEQASWYISDLQWWKSWNEKKSTLNNQLLAATGKKESK